MARTPSPLGIKNSLTEGDADAWARSALLIQERTCWRAADDHYSDAGSEAAYEGISAIEEYQPENLAELHAKLAFLIEVGVGENDSMLSTMLADMARILNNT